MTGDFNKTAYISNHPRETSTNQILNAREHIKMEVDIKTNDDNDLMTMILLHRNTSTVNGYGKHVMAYIIIKLM